MYLILSYLAVVTTARYKKNPDLPKSIKMATEWTVLYLFFAMFYKMSTAFVLAFHSPKRLVVSGIYTPNVSCLFVWMYVFNI